MTIKITRTSLIQGSLHLLGVLAMSALTSFLMLLCMSFGISGKDNADNEMWLNLCDVVTNILFFPINLACESNLFKASFGFTLAIIFWGVVGYAIAFVMFRIVKNILQSMTFSKRGEIIIGSIGFIGLLVYSFFTFGDRFHFFDFLDLPGTGFLFAAVLFAMLLAILMVIIGFALASSLANSLNKKLIVAVYFAPLIIEFVLGGIIVIPLFKAFV